ncbi:DUF892 family protein [Burkholderia sp. Ap-962]|uniref:DUF892 family protein n=1 Tax=Burkholderia sp. Ap-962 TaxID=2608333 RepID=UPI001420BF12|nr:DUF892 family protein [Burkholderia sp. Ap-962]
MRRRLTNELIMAPIRTIDLLLLRTLSKFHHAEKQAARLFSTLSRLAADPALATCLQARREATLRRLALIESLAAQCAIDLNSTKCLAMEGLAEEIAELIEATRPGEVLDAGMRIMARRVMRGEQEMLADARMLASLAGRSDVLRWLDQPGEGQGEGEPEPQTAADGKIGPIAGGLAALGGTPDDAMDDAALAQRAAPMSDEIPMRIQ